MSDNPTPQLSGYLPSGEDHRGLSVEQVWWLRANPESSLFAVVALSAVSVKQDLHGEREDIVGLRIGRVEVFSDGSEHPRAAHRLMDEARADRTGQLALEGEVRETDVERSERLLALEQEAAAREAEDDEAGDGNVLRMPGRSVPDPFVVTSQSEGYDPPRDEQG